jgi:hypothetical protein
MRNEGLGCVSAISGSLAHRSARWGIAVMVLMTVSARTAAAQGSAVPDPGVRAGETVWVTTSGGTELKGSVVSSSSTSVTLNTVADLVTVPLIEVRRIEVRDSLTNGALIGALIGGGISAWAGITLDRDCDGSCGNWGAITRLIAVGAGAGALAGMGIDALIRREIRRSPSSSRSVAVVPTLSKRHRAVRLVVRW